MGYLVTAHSCVNDLCFEIAWDGSFWCLGVLRTLQFLRAYIILGVCLSITARTKCRALQTSTRHHYWHLDCIDEGVT